MLRCALAIGLATTFAAAQALPPTGKSLLIDRVVATVNDGAILFSELRLLAAGRVQSLENRLQRRLQAGELLAVYRDMLEARIERHTMAQAAKSFGNTTPEQLEQTFQADLKAEREEQLRLFGTVIDLSRELERQGVTWQSHVRDRRIESYGDYAEALAVDERLRRNSALYVTPRRLRETYEENRAMFHYGPRARVTALRFDRAEPAALEPVAKAWAAGNQSPADLLREFKDLRATETNLMVDDAGRESLAPEVVAFAETGQPNQVSAPVQIGGAWWLLKVTERVPGADGRFEDPLVQARLRSMVLRKAREELRAKAISKSREQSEVWIIPDFRK